MTELLDRGTICWVKLDPIQGSEIGKTRPALIISNDINNELADTITVIPITTSTIKKIYPFEVGIPKGTGNLKEDSRARANQIRTIDKKRVISIIGHLPDDLIRQVEAAIKIHLSLK